MPHLRTLVCDLPTGTDPVLLEGQAPRARQSDKLVAGCHQSFQLHCSIAITIITGDFPTLEPRHVISTWLQHVVSIPIRNWHKHYCVGVADNFLNVNQFLNIFLTLLAIGFSVEPILTANKN